MADKFTLASNKATDPFKLKSTDALALDFEKLDEKGLKKLTAAFKKKKLPVKTVTAPNKAKRANGIQQKDFKFEFEDGQTLAFFVKSDGTIFQVKLNNKVIPVTNSTNMTKAIDELAKKVLANTDAYTKARAKREAALANKKIRPPKPKVTTTRKQKIDEANTAISALDETIGELKKQYEELAAENTASEDERKSLQEQLAEAEAREQELRKEISELEKKGYTYEEPAAKPKSDADWFKQHVFIGRV